MGDPLADQPGCLISAESIGIPYVKPAALVAPFSDEYDVEVQICGGRTRVR